MHFAKRLAAGVMRVRPSPAQSGTHFLICSPGFNPARTCRALLPQPPTARRPRTAIVATGWPAAPFDHQEEQS